MLLPLDCYWTLFDTSGLLNVLLGRGAGLSLRGNAVGEALDHAIGFLDEFFVGSLLGVLAWRPFSLKISPDLIATRIGHFGVE